jgi:hypothetical protein
LDRVNYSRMAMTCRNHRDPGGEIEKSVAVHIVDDRPLSVIGNQWIPSRVRGRENFRIPFDHLPRTRPGKRSDQMRQILTDYTGHRSMSSFYSKPKSNLSDKPRIADRQSDPKREGRALAGTTMTLPL